MNYTEVKVKYPSQSVTYLLLQAVESSDCRMFQSVSVLTVYQEPVMS
jgi:hypothetical protein